MDNSAVRQIAADSVRARVRARMRFVAMIGVGIVVAGVGAGLGRFLFRSPQQVGGAGVLAPSRAPALAPATRPAEGGEVDWSSPAAVVAASVRYAMTPDPERYLETVHADNAEEQRVAEGLARVYARAQYLNELAKARFGPDARLGLVGSREDVAPSRQEEWKVAIEGDRATVSTRVGARMHHLRRVEGKWKVLVYQTNGPALSPGAPAGALANRLHANAWAMDRTAEELLAGRFDTAEEARAFLQSQAWARMRAMGR